MADSGGGHGFGFDWGSSSSKTSQPWDKQIAAWLGLGLFSPFGARGFEQLKPNMYKNMFGDIPGMGDIGGGSGQLPPEVERFRRYMGEYTPFSFLNSNPFGREGGPSAEEQGIMKNSLGGLTAGLNSIEAPPALMALFKQQMGKESTDLASRFAGEGAFGGSAMGRAIGEGVGQGEAGFRAQMALANQSTNQRFLDALQEQFFGPGKRMIDFLAPYLGIQNVGKSKASDQGISIQ